MGIETATLLLIGGAAVGGAAAAGAFSGGGGVDIPTETAGNVKRTATPEEQVSESGRKRRRRRAFGLTRGLGEPRLGLPGLEAAGGLGGGGGL